MSAFSGPARAGGRFYAVALSGAAALALFVRARGVRPRVPWEYYQILDAGLLRDRLGESLLHLHAQPPLLNLGLGLALKASAATGVAVESLVLAAHALLGAAGLWALGALAGELLATLRARCLVVAAVLLNPALYLALFEGFYTFLELCLLPAIGLFATRYLRRGGERDFVLAAIGVALLTNLRAAYPAPWALGTLALLLLLRRGVAARDAAATGRTRRVALAAAAAAALSLAWPLKNLALFDFFGSSSWLGLSAAKHLVEPGPRLLGFFVGAEDSPPLRAGAQGLVPPELRAVPAVANLVKSGGAPNWNHAAILALSPRLLASSVERVRAEPAVLARRAQRFYVAGWSTSTGRHPFTRSLGWEPADRLPWSWRKGYELIFFQPLGVTWGGFPLTAFSLGFPALALWIGATAVRRRAADPAGAATVALLMSIVLWILALTLLVDGDEGNRFRYPTESLLLLAAAWAWEARRGDGRPAPAPGG
jgi:hypothetical protein